MGILLRLIVACVAATALLTYHAHADRKEQSITENAEQILGSSAVSKNIASQPAASPTEKPYDYSNRMPTYRPNIGRIPVHPNSAPHSSFETDKIEQSISGYAGQILGDDSGGAMNIAAQPAATPTEKPYDYSNRMPTYRPNIGRIPVHPNSAPHSSPDVPNPTSRTVTSMSTRKLENPAGAILNATTKSAEAEMHTTRQAPRRGNRKRPTRKPSAIKTERTNKSGRPAKTQKPNKTHRPTTTGAPVCLTEQPMQSSCNPSDMSFLASKPPSTPTEPSPTSPLPVVPPSPVPAGPTEAPVKGNVNEASSEPSQVVAGTPATTIPPVESSPEYDSTKRLPTLRPNGRVPVPPKTPTDATPSTSPPSTDPQVPSSEISSQPSGSVLISVPSLAPVVLAPAEAPVTGTVLGTDAPSQTLAEVPTASMTPSVFSPEYDSSKRLPTLRPNGRVPVPPKTPTDATPSTSPPSTDPQVPSSEISSQPSGSVLISVPSLAPVVLAPAEAPVTGTVLGTDAPSQTLAEVPTASMTPSVFSPEYDSSKRLPTLRPNGRVPVPPKTPTDATPSTSPPSTDPQVPSSEISSQPSGSVLISVPSLAPVVLAPAEAPVTGTVLGTDAPSQTLAEVPTASMTPSVFSPEYDSSKRLPTLRPNGRVPVPPKTPTDATPSTSPPSTDPQVPSSEISSQPSGSVLISVPSLAPVVLAPAEAPVTGTVLGTDAPSQTLAEVPTASMTPSVFSPEYDSSKRLPTLRPNGRVPVPPKTPTDATPSTSPPSTDPQVPSSEISSQPSGSVLISVPSLAPVVLAPTEAPVYKGVHDNSNAPSWIVMNGPAATKAPTSRSPTVVPPSYFFQKRLPTYRPNNGRIPVPQKSAAPTIPTVPGSSLAPVVLVPPEAPVTGTVLGTDAPSQTPAEVPTASMTPSEFDSTMRLPTLRPNNDLVPVPPTDATPSISPPSTDPQVPSSEISSQPSGSVLISVPSPAPVVLAPTEAPVYKGVHDNSNAPSWIVMNGPAATKAPTSRSPTVVPPSYFFQKRLPTYRPNNGRIPVPQKSAAPTIPTVPGSSLAPVVLVPPEAPVTGTVLGTDAPSQTPAEVPTASMTPSEFDSTMRLPTLRPNNDLVPVPPTDATPSISPPSTDPQVPSSEISSQPSGSVLISVPSLAPVVLAPTEAPVYKGVHDNSNAPSWIVMNGPAATKAPTSRSPTVVPPSYFFQKRLPTYRPNNGRIPVPQKSAAPTIPTVPGSSLAPVVLVPPEAPVTGTVLGTDAPSQTPAEVPTASMTPSEFDSTMRLPTLRPNNDLVPVPPTDATPSISPPSTDPQVPSSEISSQPSGSVLISVPSPAPVVFAPTEAPVYKGVHDNSNAPSWIVMNGPAATKAPTSRSPTVVPPSYFFQKRLPTYRPNNGRIPVPQKSAAPTIPTVPGSSLAPVVLVPPEAPATGIVLGTHPPSQAIIEVPTASMTPSEFDSTMRLPTLRPNNDLVPVPPTDATPSISPPSTDPQVPSSEISSQPSGSVPTSAPSLTPVVLAPTEAPVSPTSIAGSVAPSPSLSSKTNSPSALPPNYFFQKRLPTYRPNTGRIPVSPSHAATTRPTAMITAAPNAPVKHGGSVYYINKPTEGPSEPPSTDP